MKRLITTAALIAAGAFALAGCAGGEEKKEDHTGTTETHVSENEDRIKVVATVFPAYDWVKNIAGEENENIELTLLCDKGTDMHSYQPTVEDIAKLSECDICIYTGGESERWVEDILDRSGQEHVARVNLLEILGDKAKKEETVEGMQESGEEEEDGYDEHVWLSLKNAELFTDSIAETLMIVDGDIETFKNNAEKYVSSLKDLDAKYTETVNNATVKTLLFGDRFPFRYMTDDYGIGYYAAFDGCEADAEASFETIVFLAKKVDELSLNNIIKIDGSDGKLAETIKASTQSKDQNILELDSMQSVTGEQIDSGVTYLSVMEKNLDVLKEALK